MQENILTIKGIFTTPTASVEKYLEGNAFLKEYEIVSHGSYIIGFPGETYQTVKDTINFIEKSGIDFYRAQLWYCEPITPIWRQREKYKISGSQYEWSYETMDSNMACDLIDEAFLTVKQPIWIPQYNFEFDSIFHLLHRGLSMDQVKSFLRNFNLGIKEKIVNPHRQEVSSKVIEQIKRSCRLSNFHQHSFEEERNIFEKYDAAFDF
jgi:anaerobic magnesium-protoporphyrin IX monomethyl ester cyclase